MLYDGVCGLCDRAVQFLLRHDRRGVLTFAPLQGETSRVALAGGPVAPGGLATMVFVRGFATAKPVTFQKSDAWIEILRELGGVWSVAAALRLVPRAVRDRVYDWVAERRYGWFGMYTECRTPPPEQRSRFLP